jgi:hypothetical protein
VDIHKITAVTKGILPEGWRDGKGSGRQTVFVFCKRGQAKVQDKIQSMLP